MNPANRLIKVFTGPGNLFAKFTILSTRFIKNVPTFKNCSPTPAKSAFNCSNALRNLPEADSVICANSRPATLAKSPTLAFIKSKTCRVWLPCLPRLSNNADSLAN